ncbi:hypothetical protein [Marinomonas transparens]|uniref:Uncharacterized protein n=1 Tax=Marinomonas transparens TaxID=2795388 RepID=A0A934JWI1_9GAMM|nr:hypothetical protein [Marinomonas transparens]MBJ7538504.1 hypothetical protein [Marinomonas transparens]
MKKTLWLLWFLPLFVNAQTVEVNPVDIIYGDKIIHGRHQVVQNSSASVAVIPAEKPKLELEPNVVFSASGQGLSYLEEGAVSVREQAIYEEVNKRTDEAPFTVLFTGNIPEVIQEKRLRMMPKIGIFGDQLKKAESGKASESEVGEDVAPDTGEFSAISPSGEQLPSVNESEVSEPLTEAEKLERLIGG